VAGFIAVAESECSEGEVINIGSNFEISIGETVALIAEIMNVQIEIETDDVRLRPDKSEVERLWADNTKALELTGWQPEFAGKAGLRRGLAETIKWFADPVNLSCYKADRYNI
jgi:dTDP-glucose 4,6-dehydratase